MTSFGRILTGKPDRPHKKPESYRTTRRDEYRHYINGTYPEPDLWSRLQWFWIRDGVIHNCEKWSHSIAARYCLKDGRHSPEDQSFLDTMVRTAPGKASQRHLDRLIGLVDKTDKQVLSDGGGSGGDGDEADYRGDDDDDDD